MNGYEKENAAQAWQACEAVIANAHLGGNPARHLTAKQLSAVEIVVNAAVQFVNSKRRRTCPRFWVYGGKRFALTWSSFGILYLGRSSGERTLASRMFAV